MATIQDVAKRAGVSVGSVSRYLNGHTLRPANQAKISAAIQDLDYRENYFAKNLKNTQTYSIGILIGNMLSNFSATLLANLQEQFDQAGYNLVITSYRDQSELVREKINYLTDRSVDAILAIGIEENWSAVTELAQLKIPVVSLVTPLHQQGIASIVLDEQSSTQEVMHHFLERGYQRIGVILASEDRYVAKERLAGIEAALAARQEQLDPDLTHFVSYSFEEGKKAMALLDQQQVDAVIALNYNISLGALDYLAEQPKIIDDTFAFAHFAYQKPSAIFKPHLTTLVQPISSLAKLAAEEILHQLNDSTDSKARLQTIDNHIFY